MGKRKTAQKNTLARWAGVAIGPDTYSAQSTVLIFRVDKDKLKLYQRPRLPADSNISAGSFSGSASISTDNDEDDLTKTSILGSEETSVTSLPNLRDKRVLYNNRKSTIDPHPFFSTAKRKLHDVQTNDETQNVPLNVLDGNRDLSSTTRASCETYSFFKPRAIARASDKSADGLPTMKETLTEASYPTRITMHVISRDSNFQGEDVIGKSRSDTRPLIQRLQRPRATGDNWNSADWEQMCHSCLRRARTQTSSLNFSRDKCFNVPMKTLSSNGTDHPALRSLANRKLHQNLVLPMDEESLWTQKYAPQNAAEVLQDGDQVMIFRDWLKSRRMHNNDRLQFSTLSRRDPLDKYAGPQDDFIVDDDIENGLTSDIGAELDSNAEIACPVGREILFKSHLIILTGPTGCGKSAAVQAVAKELAFEVFEVNSTDRRSAKDVIDRVGEASQSQMVNKQRSADGTRSRSLILFEEVDVLYRDDKDFWTAVLSLATTSKRPIVLTCIDKTVLPRQLDMPSIQIELKNPPPSLTLQYLQGLIDVENVAISNGTIAQLLQHHSMDLRATLNALQFRSLKAHHDNFLSCDATSQELMSNQYSVSTLFQDMQPAESFGIVSRSLLAAYHEMSGNISYIDLIASQQRSSALEASESFENDHEEELARPSLRDDVVGLPIISEPYGRYTRLHPGDVDIATSFAFMAQAAISKDMRSRLPSWVLPQVPGLVPNCKAEVDRHRNWTKIELAGMPFSEPENWKYDHAPHSCMNRPPASGILAAEVMPYLRSMTCTDEREEAWEKATLLSHSGRTTRNTMLNEYGLKRKSKIPQLFRKAIKATQFAVEEGSISCI